MSSSPKKGYLLVFSRPTHPAFSTSHDTFNKWYNEIHIPDILRLGRANGFTCAFCYARAGLDPSKPSSTANTDLEVTYPKDEQWLYLAMYPVPDVERASRPDSGLYKAPLEHELLPAPGKAMEVAKWELGFWEVVGEGGSDSPKDTDVILVPVDSSDIPGYDVPGAHPSALLDYSRKGWEGPDPVRSRLLKFTTPAFNSDGTGLKQYLAVHEVEPNTEQTLKPEFKTVKYKLYKKFGV